MDHPWLTPLECRAVRPGTQLLYDRSVSDFLSFCRKNDLRILGCDANEFDALDLAVTKYLNQIFVEGQGVEMASRVVAALRHVIPKIGRLQSGNLPRTMRALKGFSNLAPSHQRLPLPRPAALAIAGLLACREQPQMALWVALSFIAYLRPSECLAMTGRSIVVPIVGASQTYQRWGLLIRDAYAGQPGKTGLLDESVILDLDVWIYPALKVLKSLKRDDQGLWDFDANDLRLKFQRAAYDLGLHKISNHLYGLRHGGASDDLLSGRRSIEAIQKRGRWASPASLKRYTKETRLLHEMAKIDKSVFEYGVKVQENFSDVLSRGPRSRAGAPPCQ